MKLKEFSEKSVKAAEAANTLGFDCIEKYAVDKCGGRISVPHVRMMNVKTSCELDSKFFPELEVGEKISILYIIHFRECNKLYKERGMYQDE